MIVALSLDIGGGYRHPNCGRCVRIQYQGKTVNARVVDSCPGCPSTSLDLSPPVFSALDHLDRGVLQIQWEFVPCSGGGYGGLAPPTASSSRSAATTPTTTSSMQRTSTTTSTRLATTTSITLTVSSTAAASPTASNQPPRCRLRPVRR